MVKNDVHGVNVYITNMIVEDVYKRQGLKGPNTTNCHFSIFSTHEKTKAWEKGKAKGDAKAIKAGRKLFERAARNRED